MVPHLNTQPDRPQRWAAGAALAATGIALLLAGCSAAPVPDPPTSTAATAASPAAVAPTAVIPTTGAARGLHGSYVALGDSYTAGLGIPGQTGATAGCGQSASSYPYLVARALRLDLTDMSCSSATIGDMTAAQPTGNGTNPAQLSRLSSGTAVVTLSIGGNDIGMIDIVTKCTELDLVPSLLGGRATAGPTPCEDYYRSGGADQIERRIQAVAGRLTQTLTEIRQRSPRARVYVIGYPDLLPADGDGCAAAVGITAGDVAFLNREEVRLNALLKRVARAAGDGYVDTYAPSERHDACAAASSRWLEPLMPSGQAAPLHPNAAGERAMAAAVLAAIEPTS